MDERILPRHIGIIMDGNGRWAKKRLMPRTAGHVQGAKAFRKCMRHCIDIGIECVTFYAFSTENWKRPKEEVNAIMKLFSDYLDEGLDTEKDDVVMRFIGDMEPLDDSLKRRSRSSPPIPPATMVWCATSRSITAAETIYCTP